MSLEYSGESSDFTGKELEEAYAKAFATKVVGGFDDRGKDIILPSGEGAQVKSSVFETKKFLAESLRRRDFIPMCIGLPGNSEEMLASIKKFGAWVGEEVPKRKELLEAVAKIRDLCYNENRLLDQLEAIT